MLILWEQGLQACLPLQHAERRAPLLLDVGLEPNQVKINKGEEREMEEEVGARITLHGVSHLRHSAMFKHPTDGYPMPSLSSWPGLNTCHGPQMNICSNALNRALISSTLKHQHQFPPGLL